MAEMANVSKIFVHMYQRRGVHLSCLIREMIVSHAGVLVVIITEAGADRAACLQEDAVVKAVSLLSKSSNCHLNF